jgi:hypothetical protein
VISSRLCEASALIWFSSLEFKLTFLILITNRREESSDVSERSHKKRDKEEKKVSLLNLARFFQQLTLGNHAFCCHLTFRSAKERRRYWRLPRSSRGARLGYACTSRINQRPRIMKAICDMYMTLQRSSEKPF